MKELMDKLDQLEKALDEVPLIQELKKLTKEIKQDKTLYQLLMEYHQKPTESTKKKIIANDLFSRYKEKETDLNILIMELNQKLKEITGKGKNCQ